MKVLQHMYPRPIKRLIGLLVVLTSLIFLDLDSFARAGGGGGYSGGGGGGSFGSGSFHGGGSGGSRKPWSEMSKQEKMIGLLQPGGFLLVWCLIIVQKVREKMQQGDLVHVDVGETGFVRIDFPRHLDLERQLQAVDESFDADSFIGRFELAFLAVQDAWQHQDMNPVRHFVSDGIFERFNLQIDEQIDLGYRNCMEDIKVYQACLVDVHRGAFFETVTVLVNASAIDYRVDKDTGKHLSGSKSSQRFAEYWSFIRRLGTKTSANDGGLIEGFCPNCHTEIRMNQGSKCPSCRAVLRSGEYDWVLAEITQSCEWSMAERLLPAYIETYQTFDPGFNVQHIEDRASVIFWRKVYADRKASASPLKKMASDAYCGEYDKRLKQQTSEPHRVYFGDCAVGGVDCLGVIRRDDVDYAIIKIKWAGYKVELQKGGKVYKRDWSRRASLFVLMRKKGIKTDLATSIQSAHCPACGAAESDVVSHACDYCGAVLNSGEHDWVLTVECAFHSSEAFQWRQSLEHIETNHRSNKSSMDLTEWVIQMVAADGLMQSEEQEAILSLCAKQGLEEWHAKGLMQAVTQRHGEETKPPDTSTGKQWLEAVADIALADGVVSDEEKAVLLKLGAYMDWSEIDVNLLINKRRALL